MAYRCSNRIAIFSQSDTSTPTAEDALWWSDNNCRQDAINFNRTYYVLSDPLDAIDLNSANNGEFGITPDPVDGSCGVSHQQLLSDAPTDGLCAAGTASSVLGAGPWTWSCAGIGEGSTDAQCSADLETADPANDEARVAALAEIITAYELFGVDNGTYKTTGGYKNNGLALFHNNSNNNYAAGSTAEALIAGGYLAAPAPADPLHPVVGQSSTFDFMAYRCSNRVAIFSQSDTSTPTAEDALWWSDNNCRQDAINFNRTYYVLSDPLDAIDLNSANNGEFGITPDPVDGSCGVSHQQLLSDAPTDGLCAAGTASSVLGAGPWTWSCAGIGEGSTDAQCSADLETTDPANDEARVAALAEIITAYELFGVDNGTYKTTGGYKNNGLALFHNNSNNNYAAGSTAEALIAGGYLAAPAPADPLHPVVGQSSTFDFMAYRCSNRVAIFSQSDTSTPTAEDALWWSDNNCRQDAINFNRTYYVLSDPLDAIDLNSANNGEFGITPDPVDGSCGVSHQQILSSAPTEGLCTAGLASSVLGAGPWTWSCAGIGDDSADAQCSADLETTDPANDEARVAALAEIITAYELFGVDNGTYKNYWWIQQQRIGLVPQQYSRRPHW